MLSVLAGGRRDGATTIAYSRDMRIRMCSGVCAPVGPAWVLPSSSELRGGPGGCEGLTGVGAVRKDKP